MFWTRHLSHRLLAGGSGGGKCTGIQRLLAPWISRNLDFVATNKLRRGVSWQRLYSDLWSKERLKVLLVQMGRRMVANLTRRQGRTMITTLSGATLYTSAQPTLEAQANLATEETKVNGGEVRRSSSSRANTLANSVNPKQSPQSSHNPIIPDEVMTSHVRDLDYAHKLTHFTLTCQDCGDRHLIDQQVEGVTYCSCPSKKSSVYGVLGEKCAESDTCWAPFLERKDVIVWRREHHQHRGLYAYKMYGRFDDVTAQEFLDIQMDLSEFRLKWDISTAHCHIISQTITETPDPEVWLETGFTSDWSQVYYWEVNWPRFFSNRDYVCARRAVIIDDDDPKDKRIVVYSKSTDHSSYPEKSKTVRVEDYVSVLTIRPFESFDRPGIEFSLTAFENPGLSLPSSITTWVALRAMPEFMANLRKACLEMRKWKRQPILPLPSSPREPTKEPPHIETPQNSYSYHQNKQSSASSAYA